MLCHKQKEEKGYITTFWFSQDKKMKQPSLTFYVATIKLWANLVGKMLCHKQKEEITYKQKEEKGYVTTFWFSQD